MADKCHKTMAPPGWESLPLDLVRRVADLFLATSDMDYYMSLRAVCHSWRAATDYPSWPDPRFSPRGWVLVASLDGDHHQMGCRCLFLHVNTGRFLWKDLPCNYTCVASTEDGHLVLNPALRNSRICLLNPMSGRLVRLPVTPVQSREDRRSISMFATGSSLVLYRLYSLYSSNYGGCIDLTWDSVYNRESLFSARPFLGMLTSMVPFKGRAYAVSRNGTVVVVEHNCRLDEKPNVTTVVTSGWHWNWRTDRATFLVDNAGELLLVSLLASKNIELFRVDLENGLLEQIKSIGNRAIFLGKWRCLSLD